MTHIDRIDTAAMLDRMAAAAASVTPHVLPVLRAARAGLIGLAIPNRATAATFLRDLAVSRRPVLVLIGDDPIAGAAIGPDGWRCPRRLPWWARAAIVHGSGPAPDHYAFTVGATLGHGRVVMVETDSAHLDAWAALFANRMPVTTIRPPDDRQHPAPPAREAMQ